MPKIVHIYQGLTQATCPGQHRKRGRNEGVVGVPGIVQPWQDPAHGAVKRPQYWLTG